ncbi:MAG: hypothetical protein ABEJ24_00010 [Candidatus Magasanikbacteria bacterium]
MNINKTNKIENKKRELLQKLKQNDIDIAQLLELYREDDIWTQVKGIWPEDSKDALEYQKDIRGEWRE